MPTAKASEMSTSGPDDWVQQSRDEPCRSRRSREPRCEIDSESPLPWLSLRQQAMVIRRPPDSGYRVSQMWTIFDHSKSRKLLKAPSFRAAKQALPAA